MELGWDEHLERQTDKYTSATECDCGEEECECEQEPYDDFWDRADDDRDQEREREWDD